MPSSAPPTLWPYPDDVLHVLAPHLSLRAFSALSRTNSHLHALLTPTLYHTMTVDDRHYPQRLRRALHAPGAQHTRTLLIDAQHSCDECHAGGAPNLPSLDRVVLFFDRGAGMHKAEGVWPDDPCRVLSRARPDIVVLRVRNRLIGEVLPALKYHMRAEVYARAEVVVSTLLTGHPVQPEEEGLIPGMRVTQILLPTDGLDVRRTWDGLRRLAVAFAEDHAGHGELRMVGLEEVPPPEEPPEDAESEEEVSERPSEEATVNGATEAEAEAEVDKREAVEGEGESETAFRLLVAGAARLAAVAQHGQGDDAVERIVRDRMKALRMVTLREYLRVRREGEVPPAWSSMA